MLLLVGVEVSPRSGRFLAFGLEEEIDHSEMSEAQISAAVHGTGALGFAAHPFSEGSRMSRRIGRPHPWGALERDDYTGIELWSLETEAAEGWSNPLQALRFLRSPGRALDGPPSRNLSSWDRLCARRRCVAIGGLDAHQSGLRIGRRVLSPFPNERFFRYLRTHVLCERAPSGRLEDDRYQVYDALAEGRCYLAVDALAPARGFAFWGEGESGSLPMGAEGRAGDWTLHVRLPRPADLRLIRDGRELERRQAAELSRRVEGPCVYRIEGRLTAAGRPRTWILSNPVYLRDGDQPVEGQRATALALNPARPPRRAPAHASPRAAPSPSAGPRRAPTRRKVASPAISLPYPWLARCFRQRHRG